MYVGKTCGDKLAQVWVDGSPHNYTFEADTRKTQEHLTLSVPGMRLKLPQVPRPLTLCMQLVSPCDSLLTFCINGVCRYSIFDVTKSCCPVGNAIMPPALRPA